MSKIKICMECKHYTSVEVYHPYAQFTHREPKCMRNAEVNLVTGLKFNGVDAYDQRAKVSATYDRCGEKGKYWEKANG